MTGTPSTVADPHGTIDGGTAYEQICGAGMVLVGLDAASDPHALSGFAPLCAPLRLNGAPGQIAIGTGDVQALMPLGNRLVPQPITRLSCPGDHVITGVRGAEALLGPESSMFYGIQQLTLDCAHISVDPGERLTSTIDGTIDVGSLDGTIQMFSDLCPAGQVVAGFTGGADGIIDRLQTLCTPLTVSRQTDN
jgi:hypothetical protein